MKNLKNKKLQDVMLTELWENSTFDKDTFNILQKALLENPEVKSNKKADQTALSKEHFFELTTMRNRNLISATEQLKLRQTVVGFFGLSVGSHCALSWMMESRADNIKIVDPDRISMSNLNRLPLGVEDVDEFKTEVISKRLLEINPFCNVVSSTNGSVENFKKLFDTGLKIDVCVDAIDDMQGKVVLRKMCRERKLPLIQAGDIGDNVLLDIERYDLTPQPDLFLGRLPGIETVDFSTMSPFEIKKMIVKLVGFEQNNENLLESVLTIGQKLATWPQLGATATIAGGVVATSIKKIVLNEKVKSGRYYISLDNLLVSDFGKSYRIKKREKLVDRIKNKMRNI